MRWFRRREAAHERSNPTQPHPFRETHDPGIGMMGAPTGPQAASAQLLAAATSTLRATRCAVPGCGKERHDVIHALADE
jgi:hypothetical protein